VDIVHCSTAQTYVAVMGNSTNDFNYFGPVEEYEDYLDRPIFYLDAQNPGDASIHLFAPVQALSTNDASAARALHNPVICLF
jgi:hypothetical protein